MMKKSWKQKLFITMAGVLIVTSAGTNTVFAMEGKENYEITESENEVSSSENVVPAEVEDAAKEEIEAQDSETEEAETEEFETAETIAEKAIPEENTAEIEKAEAGSEDVTASFTDLNFRASVRTSLGLGENEPITKTACAEATSLYVMGSANPWIESPVIKSLAGIENFTALETLNCSYNELTSLDVRACTNLETLDCSYNLMDSLDVGACTNLKTLYCSMNGLKNLNVGNCTELATLSCGANKLTNLEIRNCTALEFLSCDRNQLTALNIGNCLNLKTLYCQYNKFTKLDLENCPALTDLVCGYNKLTSLNVENCPNLVKLSCSGNPIKNLNVDKCTALTELSCFENGLSKLNVKNCTKLEYLECYGNQLTSLDVSKCTALKYLSCRENYMKSAANVVGKNANLTGDSFVFYPQRNAQSSKVKPATVNNVKSTPTNVKGTLKVTWKKVPQASGYMIRYSYGKNMKNAKTVNVPKGGTVSNTIKKLSSKKYVYVQVRAYKVEGGLIIPGNWSKVAKSTKKIK